MHKADDVLGFKKQDVKPRDHNCVQTGIGKIQRKKYGKTPTAIFAG